MNVRREFLKWKMRVCGQGFSQQEGYDYYHSYSNTVPLSVFRLFLSYCAEAGLEITEADYATAYLNAKLTEDIWMEQIPGFPVEGPNGEPPEATVLKLNKALYGLVQSAREWQNTRAKGYSRLLGQRVCWTRPAGSKLAKVTQANFGSGQVEAFPCSGQDPGGPGLCF